MKLEMYLAVRQLKNTSERILRTKANIFNQMILLGISQDQGDLEISTLESADTMANQVKILILLVVLLAP